jgi:hypothetical protein
VAPDEQQFKDTYLQFDQLLRPHALELAKLCSAHAHDAHMRSYLGMVT